MDNSWVIAPNSAERYEVNRLGEIRNAKTKNLVRGVRDTAGYVRVRYRASGKVYSFAAHVAIAKAFIPNPENRPEVNHIDGDKTNNRVDNLEWCTHKENIVHAWKTGLITPMMYSNPVKVENTKTGITEVFSSQKDAADFYNIPQASISYALHHTRKNSSKHSDYLFNFV
jgi:hypothetical protein